MDLHGKLRQQMRWFRLGVLLTSSTIWFGCASTEIPVACDQPRSSLSGLPDRGLSAHRGGVLGCPENTLGAFQRAICLGVHQIELDVRATADAELVVAHDDRVSAQDGRTLKISQSTLTDVQALRLAPCTGEKVCQQRIPMLEDVLAIMPKNIWINLDIKKNNPLIARLVAETVAQADRFEQVIFGVRDEAAPAVRRVEKVVGKNGWINNMSRKILRSQYVDTTLASCDEFIQLTSFRGKPSREIIDRLKQADVRVNYSWIDEEEEEALGQKLGGLFDRGVNFVLVDHAEPAMNAAQALGISPVVPKWKGRPPFSCSDPLPSCAGDP
ncbi:glycerophosphodiester phosphodiesterase [Candidatus Nitrospira salsa]|nr:MAG: hypothetical protein NPIRA01_12630 [Nitrospirales bacterium]